MPTDTPTRTDLDLTEQITIAKTHRDTDGRTVPGLTVAPGLAVTPAFRWGRNSQLEPIPHRYSITYVPSGLKIPTGTHCATHVRQAVAALVNTGVDWTRDRDALLADKDRFAEVAFSLRNLCPNDRYGCPGDPEPWLIRCATCDWEYDPDFEHDDDIPADAKAAKRIADDHECEPWVEIQAPGDTVWQSPNSFDEEEAPR
jgi:hypothetical protein